MSPVTILYVDDDPNLLEIGRIYLGKLGNFKVDTALSAKVALEKLALLAYDAIISDYEMPKMNGIEFLKEVRKEYHTLPFIIFTGRGREEIVIEAINSGANSYLQKGGDPEAQFTELVHRVRQTVQINRADLALHESDEKFYKIFNSVNDAIHIHEIDDNYLPGKFIDVNDAACRMLQYERAELLTKTPLDFTVEEHSRPLDKIGNTLKNEGNLIFETEHIRKDGTRIPVEIHAHVALMSGKKVVVSVIRDISERIRENKILRAEVELTTALQKVRGLTETLNICLSFALEASGLDSGEIYLIDPSTGSLDLNVSKNVQAELRVSVAQYPAGTTFTSLVTAGKPCYFASGQSAPVHPGTTAASGVRAYAIIPVNSQDHTIGCMALSSREGDEISSHARIVLETIATVIGIAIEKARADERGRANAVRLETALEMGNLAWWEMELPQGTVRFDARKATILGYSPERFVHYSDFTSLLHPEDYERTMQAMRDHITGKVPRYLVDYRICAADGSYHWFRDIGGVTRSNPDGSPQIVTGIVMDITAVKGMEAELARNHELLQAAFDNLAENEEELRQNYNVLAESEHYTRLNEERLTRAQEMGRTGCWEYNLVTGEIWGSAEGLRIFGFPPIDGDFPIAEIENCIPERERVHQALADLITGNNEYDLEYAINPADGSPQKMIHSIARLEKDAQGRPLRILGVIQDITVSKALATELAKKHEELQAAFVQLAANEKVLQWNYAELEKSSAILARREEEFRNLFTNMEEGLATHELVAGKDGRVVDYRILSVNPSFERILGIRAAEIIGKTGKEAYKTSDSPYMDIYSRVARTRKPESFVTYFPPMDKHFRISVYSPKAGRFATIFSDISKEFRQEEALRKKNTDLEAAYEELTATGEEIRQNFEELIKNQHELRKSEERYRRIVETAREGIWAMDREFRTTFVNRQFAEFLGYLPEEMIGRDIYSFIPEDEQADLRQKLEERKIGKAGSYERRYLTKKGEVRWGLVSATPLFAADGTFDGSFAMVTDITAQKDTEFALKEKNANLEAAYEELTATEEEIRQNLEELGRNQKELRKSEEKYRRIVETTHEGIWVWDQDLRITFVNARIAEMHGYLEKEILGRPITDFIDPGDRPTSDAEIKNRRQGVSGHMELRQVRKDGSVIWVQISSTPLKGSNGEFLGAFAMLTDITERKRAEMALRQANRQLNLLSSITRHDILNNITAIRSYLILAEEAAHEPSERAFLKKIGSVTHSIRDQIDFTKVYKDLGTNEPQWQALEKVIAKLALPPGISLQNETDGLEIYADLLLEKIFYNLLDNTVRHGEKADRVRITCTTTSEGLVLSWEDNGAGIPDENKEAIFDKGFGKNTGLGLFLVREILSITGITIREAGTPGSGARFEITLPVGTFRFANAGTS